MFLFEPPRTAGDLHFRLFGIPVRIHPFFWVSAVILGFRPGGTPPTELILWILAVVVSILVHELGHAFMQRRYGGSPWITLHGFGGLASCDACDNRPGPRIAIALAGPAAGFVLAAIVAAAVKLSGHVLGWTWSEGFPGARAGLSESYGLRLLGGTLYWQPLGSPAGNLLLAYLLQINIAWGLINLLPIYPLDGGQVMREVFTLRQPRQGIVASLRLSMMAAGAMALLGLLAWDSLYMALLFGYLAYESYRGLQQYQAMTRW